MEKNTTITSNLKYFFNFLGKALIWYQPFDILKLFEQKFNIVIVAFISCLLSFLGLLKSVHLSSMEQNDRI